MKTFVTILLLALPFIAVAAPASTAHLCASNGSRIQQLRIYEVDRSNRDHFHQRFRDHAARIMKTHDFDIVDIWESDTGEKLQFVYVLEWPDQATMDERWKALLADEEWIQIKQRTGEEHGRFVKSAHGQPLVRLSYSPACRG